MATALLNSANANHADFLATVIARISDIRPVLRAKKIQNML